MSVKNTICVPQLLREENWSGGWLILEIKSGEKRFSAGFRLTTHDVQFRTPRLGCPLRFDMLAKRRSSLHGKNPCKLAKAVGAMTQ